MYILCRENCTLVRSVINYKAERQLSGMMPEIREQRCMHEQVKELRQAAMLGDTLAGAASENLTPQG